MFRLVIILAFLGVAAPAAAQQQQQTPCSQRTNFIDHLQGKFAEAPIAMGLVSNGSVLEVLASNNGSWTIIVTAPNGLSCAVATGESWETMPLKLSSQGPIT